MVTDENDKYYRYCSIAVSTALFILGFLYCLTNLEANLLTDWYFQSQKIPLPVHNLSVANAYLYSVDPVRNLLLRTFNIETIEGLWRLSTTLFLLMGVLVFLVLNKILFTDKKDYFTTFYLTFLLLINLVFIKLIQGTGSLSLLFGCFIFFTWKTLILYDDDKKWWWAPILVVTALANLILLPLVAYGSYFYYQKQQREKWGSFTLFLLAIILPCSLKYQVMTREVFYYLGSPVELSSYLDGPLEVLSFSAGLTAVFSGVGKLLIPIGLRQFYMNLTFVDMVGSLLLFTLIIIGAFRAYQNQKLKKSATYCYLVLVIFALFWPIIYRQFFPYDKITSFQLTADVFFQTINNEDLIPFYIVALIPLIFYFTSLKEIKRSTLIPLLLIQVFLVGAYGPKILKTESYVKSQLRSEINNPFLNLSYLFYANKNSEKFTQIKMQPYLERLNKRANKKMSILGKVHLTTLLRKYNANNWSEVELDYIEKFDFHPWIMIDIYLYFQEFDKHKKAIYELWNNYHVSSLLRTRLIQKASDLKNRYYWDTLFYMALESRLMGNDSEAKSLMLMAYHYARSERELFSTKNFLRDITERRNITSTAEGKSDND